MFSKLEKSFPEKKAQDFLKKSLDFLRSEKIIPPEIKDRISLVNVSKKEIQKLNHQYRDKNESTDILSFGYKFDEKKLEGDLVLCWEVIIENAVEDGIDPETELAKNLIHGCLHLAGFEHSDEMFNLQEKFLKVNCSK